MVSEKKQSQQQESQSKVQQQSEKLAKYNAWLEPFKLYVEWSEMHKLRAQLQLISDDIKQQRSAEELFEDAKKQKKLLDERYQDALLIQSESIAYLERGLAAFKKLDEAKFKRLKRICDTLKEFQAEGRIGEAEQDRGDELVKELRLLAVAKGVPVEISFEREKTAKRGILNWGRKSKNIEKEVVSFEELELAEQSRYLEKLAQRYANVFDYRRDLSKQLRALRKTLKEEKSIASDLASFQDYLKVAKNELRNQLKAELTEIDQSIGDIQQGLETQQLTRALKVTTQILDAALPNRADVKEIRDHHRMLMQQTQAFSAAPKKQEKPKSKKRSGRGMGKLEQQDEALEEFVNTFNSYQRFVEDDVRRAFAAQIADLKRASKEKRFDLEMISEGHRFAAVFEASALMQSHDERSMQREQLQDWIAELRAMPRVDSLRQKFHDTLRGLQSMSERMNHEDISPENFEVSAVSVQDLRDDLKAYLQKDQDYFERQASFLDNEELDQQLKLSAQDLSKNHFSSVVDIHYQIRLAYDRALSSQLSELHRLEAESDQLLSENEGDVDTLHDHLDKIRGQIEAGDLSQELPLAWELLEKAREQHDDWIIKFEARLDRLITKASKVAFLNTSSSFKLISLLSHLDDQREIFPKVSIRARRRLEDSLETAKVQLRQLRKQQQLAQSLAEELAKKNPLDNMFVDLESDSSSKISSDNNIDSEQVNQLAGDDLEDDFEEALDSNLDALDALESAFDTSVNDMLESSFGSGEDDFDAISRNLAANKSRDVELDDRFDHVIDDDYDDEDYTIENHTAKNQASENLDQSLNANLAANSDLDFKADSSLIDTIDVEFFDDISNEDINFDNINSDDINFEDDELETIELKTSELVDVSGDMADDVKAELDLKEHGELRLTEVRSSYPTLDRWLDDYLQDGSVRDALIYSREGELLAAKSWLDPDASLQSFTLLNNVAKNIGRNLGLGRYHLASVETSNRVFLGVRLRGGSSMVLLLDNSQSLHPVSNRLRRDIPTLGRIIHEAVLN